MTVLKLLQTFLVGIVLLGCALAGYAGFRYWEVEQVQRLIADSSKEPDGPLGYLTAFKDFAPFECVSISTGFQNSQRSTMQWAYGKWSFETFIPSLGQTAYQLIDDSGYYIWRSDGEYLYRIDLESKFSETFQGIEEMTRYPSVEASESCAPLWFVDEWRFKRPIGRLPEPSKGVVR